MSLEIRPRFEEREVIIVQDIEGRAQSFTQIRPSCEKL